MNLMEHYLLDPPNVDKLKADILACKTQQELDHVATAHGFEDATAAHDRPITGRREILPPHPIAGHWTVSLIAVDHGWFILWGQTPRFFLSNKSVQGESLMENYLLDPPNVDKLKHYLLLCKDRGDIEQVALMFGFVDASTARRPQTTGRRVILPPHPVELEMVSLIAIDSGWLIMINGQSYYFLSNQVAQGESLDSMIQAVLDGSLSLAEATQKAAASPPIGSHSTLSTYTSKGFFKNLDTHTKPLHPHIQHAAAAHALYHGAKSVHGAFDPETTVRTHLKRAAVDVLHTLHPYHAPVGRTVAAAGAASNIVAAAKKTLFGYRKKKKHESVNEDAHPHVSLLHYHVKQALKAAKEQEQDAYHYHAGMIRHYEKTLKGLDPESHKKLKKARKAFKALSKPEMMTKRNEPIKIQPVGKPTPVKDEPASGSKETKSGSEPKKLKEHEDTPHGELIAKLEKARTLHDLDVIAHENGFDDVGRKRMPKAAPGYKVLWTKPKPAPGVTRFDLIDSDEGIQIGTSDQNWYKKHEKVEEAYTPEEEEWLKQVQSWNKEEHQGSHFSFMDVLARRLGFRAHPQGLHQDQLHGRNVIWSEGTPDLKVLPEPDEHPWLAQQVHEPSKAGLLVELVKIGDEYVLDMRFMGGVPRHEHIVGERFRRQAPTESVSVLDEISMPPGVSGAHLHPKRNPQFEKRVIEHLKRELHSGNAHQWRAKLEKIADLFEFTDDPDYALQSESNLWESPDTDEGIGMAYFDIGPEGYTLWYMPEDDHAETWSIRFGETMHEAIQTQGLAPGAIDPQALIAHHEREEKEAMFRGDNDAAKKHAKEKAKYQNMLDVTAEPELEESKEHFEAGLIKTLEQFIKVNGQKWPLFMDSTLRSSTYQFKEVPSSEHSDRNDDKLIWQYPPDKDEFKFALDKIALYSDKQHGSYEVEMNVIDQPDKLISLLHKLKPRTLWRKMQNTLTEAEANESESEAHKNVSREASQRPEPSKKKPKKVDVSKAIEALRQHRRELAKEKKFGTELADRMKGVEEGKVSDAALKLMRMKGNDPSMWRSDLGDPRTSHAYMASKEKKPKKESLVSSAQAILRSRRLAEQGAGGGGGGGGAGGGGAGGGAGGAAGGSGAAGGAGTSSGGAPGMAPGMTVGTAHAPTSGTGRGPLAQQLHAGMIVPPPFSRFGGIGYMGACPPYDPNCHKKHRKP